MHCVLTIAAILALQNSTVDTHNMERNNLIRLSMQVVRNEAKINQSLRAQYRYDCIIRQLCEGANDNYIELKPTVIEYMTGYIDGSIGVKLPLWWRSVKKARLSLISGKVFVDYKWKQRKHLTDELYYDTSSAISLDMQLDGSVVVKLGTRQVTLDSITFKSLHNGRMSCTFAAHYCHFSRSYFVIAYGKIPRSYDLVRLDDAGKILARAKVIALPTNEVYSGDWGHDVELLPAGSNNSIVVVAGMSSYGFYVEAFDITRLKPVMKICSTVPSSMLGMFIAK